MYSLLLMSHFNYLNSDKATHWFYPLNSSLLISQFELIDHFSWKNETTARDKRPGSPWIWPRKSHWPEILRPPQQRSGSASLFGIMSDFRKFVHEVGYETSGEGRRCASQTCPLAMNQCLSSGVWASGQRRPALGRTVSHVLGLAHNGFLMGVIVSVDWEIRQQQFVKIIVY